VSEESEAGQAGGKRAGNPIRNCQVERCYPSLAKPNEKDGNNDYGNDDYYYCDCHGGGILQPPTPTGCCLSGG